MDSRRGAGHDLGRGTPSVGSTRRPSDRSAHNFSKRYSTQSGKIYRTSASRRPELQSTISSSTLSLLARKTQNDTPRFYTKALRPTTRLPPRIPLLPRAQPRCMSFGDAQVTDIAVAVNTRRMRVTHDAEPAQHQEPRHSTTPRPRVTRSASAQPLNTRAPLSFRGTMELVSPQRRSLAPAEAHLEVPRVMISLSDPSRRRSRSQAALGATSHAPEAALRNFFISRSDLSFDATHESSSVVDAPDGAEFTRRIRDLVLPISARPLLPTPEERSSLPEGVPVDSPLHQAQKGKKKHLSPRKKLCKKKKKAKRKQQTLKRSPSVPR
eukprot:gnl/Chilomastix_cuspidata/2485.p1 GENE.gnl/Chilomastix_cuspidata/2485~~gnl/Chilomastix_cuspidata/2485.p1  ORF type:complete len:324 (+),score=60.82 gnl/Chilomastix_cuspidata/2485:550-1521(+)